MKLPIGWVIACAVLGLGPITARANGSPQDEIASPRLARALPAKPLHASLSGRARTHSFTFKVMDHVDITLTGQRLLGSAELEQIYSLIRTLPGAHFERTFGRPVEDLREERLRGERSSGRALPDLTHYFSVVVPPSVPATAVSAVVTALNRLPVVEIAYLDFDPTPPPSHRTDALPATLLYEGQQGYLGAAPVGIDALYAWTQAGGRGTNVLVVDVEYAWNTNHEDGPALAFNSGVEDLWSGEDHGTAVLGILGGEQNGYGTTGIASSASFGIAGETTQAGSRVNAISAATQAAQSGSVLLLEMQVWGPSAQPCNSNCLVPAEWEPAVYDAIAIATGLGIIVVEAAGNGSFDLDHAMFNGQFTRGNSQFRDSGAVMVGGSQSVARVPMAFSNFGSRLDLHSWGEGVVTAGYGGLFNPNNDVNQRYTAGFGGTSSASAIVAGAVASFQGYALNALARPLRPLEVRRILEITGTPQEPNVSRIGPQPNLRAAIEWMDLDSDGDGTSNGTELAVRRNPWVNEGIIAVITSILSE